ncbi:MAG: S8 family serine peptidase [Phycisphaerales bacterium]|nr:S8 family serine peptidase [Phycisphaerales bacterium]
MNPDLFRVSILYPTAASAMLCALSGLSGCRATAPASDARIVVASMSDLPSNEYRIGTSSMDIVKDDAAFRAFAMQVVGDRIELLRTHRFSDPGMTRRWYRSIARIYRQIPDFESASRYEAMAGSVGPDYSLGRIVATVEAELGAEGTKRGDPGFDDRFAEKLRAEIREAPFPAVREELSIWRGAADIPDEDGIRAAAQGITDPKLKASNGAASDAIVAEVINWREAYRSLYWLRLIGPIAAALLDENAALERDEDRWTPRQVALDPAGPGREVRIGVWDTGVDPLTLGESMWHNDLEQINGLDDDHNGYVDDVHGIALTNAGSHRPGTIWSLGTLSRPYGELLDAVLAEADIARGAENAGTLAFKQHLRSLSVPDRVMFDEERGRVANFVHGTHVASIAVAGNPFARVVAAAYGFPDETEDARPPSLDSVIAEAETATKTVRYLRQQGVRVVTMSWLTSANLLEAELERHGIGSSAEERSSLARLWFREHRTRLEAAIRESPEILFVCGAGNFSDDVDFAEYIPAGLRLSNLVTVGAVDALDRPASFSSSGRGVRLYANGSNISGLVPGGRHAVFSGTSAAVPQVANLAAKMLAVNQSLTPTQILDLISETGVPVVGLPEARSIDPRAALAAARRLDKAASGTDAPPKATPGPGATGALE